MDVQRNVSYKGLAVAVLIAAVLQGILVARAPTISADGILFVTMARDLSHDARAALRQYDQHPGYPALLLGCTRLVQWYGFDSEPEAWMWGGQIVSFVCGLLSVAIVWFFARDLFDVDVANLAAVAFAVLPIPRISASDALSDTPHLAFYLLAAWLATSAIINGRPMRLAAAGVASGIAYWIRPEGLEVLLVACGCLLLQSFLARWPWRRTMVACAALTISGLLVAAPYPILAGKITSKQLPFAKQQPVPTFIEDQARLDAVQAQSVAAPPAVAQPAEPVAPTTAVPPAVAPPAAAAPAAPPVNPSQRYSTKLVLKLLGRGTVQFAVSIAQGFKFVFLPLYFLSYVALIRRNPGGMRIAFPALLGTAHLAILLSVYVLSGYIAHRHVLPMVGLAMPFTGLGIAYAGEKLGAFARLQPRYVAIGILAVSGGLILPFGMRAYNREFAPVIAATHWVEAHAEPGAGIISNSPYAGFYARLPATELIPEMPTLEAALAKAQTPARYEYVIMHVNAHGFRPQWIGQLEAHYRQVQLFPDPTSGSRPKKVLVFQAKDAQARRVKPDPL
jgi:hypothetical protein